VLVDLQKLDTSVYSLILSHIITLFYTYFMVLFDSSAALMETLNQHGYVLLKLEYV
jgi:hypothetical protein